MTNPRRLAINWLLLAATVATLCCAGCEPPRAATPTPRATVVELADAVDRDLVTAEVRGVDLRWVDVVLESLMPDPLEVTIPLGTIFEAQSSHTQDMVVREAKSVFLASAGNTESVAVPVACGNMNRGVPDQEDTFTISLTPAAEELVKLLSLPEFHEAGSFVQQFAVWTITDNPARDEYRGLGYFGVGYGPDDEDMETIRTLFGKAGIPAARYQALQ